MFAKATLAHDPMENAPGKRRRRPSSHPSRLKANARAQEILQPDELQKT